MSKRGKWIIAVGAVIVLVIVAGVGVLTWRHHHPHPPNVSTAIPILDRAIDGVVASAGTDAAVTVSGIVPTTACPGGSLYTRTADLFTHVGGENALIGTIAAALPAAESPQRTTSLGGGAQSLDASLTDGATLQVIQLDAGWVVATATSDCRSGSTAIKLTPSAPDATLTHVLAALSTAATSWHRDAIGCVVTISTASATTNVDALPARLAALVPSGATTFTSPSNRLAWRLGTVSTVIAAADSGDHLTAQTTTSC